MLLRVVMDVDHEPDKVSIGGDLYAAKGSLEERAATVVGFVEGFGVGIEQVGKALAGLL